MSELNHLLDEITKIEKSWCCIEDRINTMFPDEVPVEELSMTVSGDTSVCENGVSNLIGEVTGAVSYQWQEFVDDVWVDIVGATELTYTTDTLELGTYSYRLEATQINANVGYSDVVEVTVTENLLQVYHAAETNDFCDGGSTTVYGEVVGCDGTPTYQWQLMIDDVWVDIEGATDLNYITPILNFDEDNNIPHPGYGFDATLYKYGLLVTCGGCQMHTDTTSPGGTQGDVYVLNQPMEFDYYETEDSVICDGGVTYIHSNVINTIGGAVNYQWQQLIDDVWTDLIGQNGQSMVTDVLTTGEYSYRVVVTSAPGCFVISDPMVITVVPDPTFTISVDDDTIVSGGSFTLSSIVTGGEGPSFYQWQLFDLNGTGWTNSDIFGANSDTFTNIGSFEFLPIDLDPIAPGTYLFRAVVIQDAGCETYSNEITITVT